MDRAGIRSDFEKRLSSIWYGSEPDPAWLKGLAPVVHSASRFDRWLKNKRQCKPLPGVCVVVVGNITAGGSGKTPLVIHLCHLFKKAGLVPGVVSRGYGRQERGMRLASPASSPEVVGDEPLMIVRRTGVPVVVAANRCEAARAILKKNVNVIISDDGLQHHRLPRDIEICVIDASRGFGNGLLIPAGPLREPVERLGTVDYVIVNDGSMSLPEDIDAHQMTMISGHLRSMEDAQAWRLSQFAGCKVNAVAGIGNPDRFFRLLRKARIKVIEHAFADHYVYSESDFSSMDNNLPIVMTEKDAVKCTGLGLNNAWFLSVDAVLPHFWERQLVRQVLTKLQPGQGGNQA